MQPSQRSPPPAHSRGSLPVPARRAHAENRSPYAPSAGPAVPPGLRGTLDLIDGHRHDAIYFIQGPLLAAFCGKGQSSAILSQVALRDANLGPASPKFMTPSLCHPASSASLLLGHMPTVSSRLAAIPLGGGPKGRTLTWGQERTARRRHAVIIATSENALDDLPQRQSVLTLPLLSGSIGPGAFVVDGRARH